MDENIVYSSAILLLSTCTRVGTKLTLYKKITLQSSLERLHTLTGTIILRYAVKSPVDCIVLWNTVL